ncbi:MAG: MaoC family dehydratase N-terminal domain-containing protein [Alphaproteobacteria bacterium]|nr:MaoC family dehydratase N-terminal domain-containing protein [Alphaproteobacteria bacterium]
MSPSPRSPSLDLAHLREWIGREETAEDVLTAALAQRFHATLGLPGSPARVGEVAPRLIHFCLCQPAVPTAELGRDGHPPTGGFLPPVPLPRRMWAASSLSFAGDLCVGDRVKRRSRIAGVTMKEGRSGALCFVTVEHQISTGAKPLIEELQTLVYRGAETAPKASSPATPPAAQPAVESGETVVSRDATPPLLFRYSALTFNSHRIHYDLPYAMEEEGYPGLVVHGPLQATLLFHLAAQCRFGQPPDRFEFRSASPLFAHDPLVLHAGPLQGHRIDVWSARPGGPAAMRAEAFWR